VSAASTRSVAFVFRCVIVRRWSWMCRKPPCAESISGSARTMSAAGLKLLSAALIVGATMISSFEYRQFRTSAVSMMPAAIVDLPFFFAIERKNSLIRRLPASGS
jgi:hypothetical protein